MSEVLTLIKKWDAARDRVVKSKCDIVYLQETKKQSFDLMFIKTICTPSFDAFEFIPSLGASGGWSIVIWKSSLFTGTKIFQNDYCLSLEFCSMHNNDIWILSNIYVPCATPGKREFLSWFKNVHMPDSTNWLLVGDFNLYRSPADRNKPGGDHTEMYLFNEAVSALGLIELHIKGRRFTWTNKQFAPLLERLDWFFTSANWTITYPTTFACPLVMETSDHVPSPSPPLFPREVFFLFENFWLDHYDFMTVVQQG
jgi:exonuclease III